MEPSAQMLTESAVGQGAAVFLAGNALQLHSHWLLARLRSPRPRAAVPERSDVCATPREEYSVPRGGAFELVSCPHYLAEIVIYAGLALVAGRGRLLPWLILAWVVRPPLRIVAMRVLGGACCMHLWWVSSSCAGG